MMKLNVYCLAALAAFSISGSAFALTLDGLVADLGTAVATDPVSPSAAAGDEGGAGPNNNVDLENLYLTNDGTSVALAMTIDADIGATNWGKYKIYIQTDNGGAGNTTTDPWGRAIRAGGSFSPQYAVSAWVDGGGGSEFHQWNGASWVLVDATYAGADANNHAFAISAAGNAGGRGGVEWMITRAGLGSPATIQVQGVSTAGGAADNGQDTVPSQANATDWSTVTVLATPTGATAAPVTLSGLQID